MGSFHLDISLEHHFQVLKMENKKLTEFQPRLNLHVL